MDKKYVMMTTLQASEWRPTRSDLLYVGACHNLDLSRKVAPGRTWNFKIALNDSRMMSYRNFTEGRGMAFIMLREREEDFFAGGSKMSSPLMPQGIFLDVGKLYNLGVSGKVARKLIGGGLAVRMSYYV